jgi:DNA-binding MarR family transcriptional regulator
MWNGVTSLLVNKPTKDNNYLQYMINSYKQGIDVHFEKKNFLFNACYEDIARCYIQMAKAGLVELLDDLEEETLLEIKSGERDNLLTHLIRLDRDTTVNKILGVKMMKKPKINAALKVLSRDGLIDIPFAKYDADEICRIKMNEMYTEGLVSPCEDLLTELRELFENDPDSDITLVNALITSYRYVTAVNPIFIEELKVLINIKKNNPDFHYKKINSGAYFDGECVCCDDTTIGTLIHETGHAIHHYTTNEAIPDGFYELIDKIRNSPGWIHKVVEYSNKFLEIREKIHKRAVDIVTKVMAANLTSEDEEEIDRLLNEEKERIKKLYLNKGYTEEELDAILSSTFTKKEFMAQKATIEVGEVEDFLMRHLYDAFTAIGDFIDGITYGHFRSKVLKDEEGKVIPSGYGHGVRYYKTRYLIFCEMVANYSEIIKSKHSKEIIALLRHIVGDELVDMLDNFYQNEMIGLPEYEMNEEETAAVGRSR